MTELLKDGHGRPIGDLRISVIDRCNFRCQYCMPAEGLPWLERADLLTFEEIERIVRVMAPMGVNEIRLTGGEPTVRKDLPRLVAMLAAVDELEEISLTTNGYLLERHAEALVRAGVNRFNVSIDSLQRDRFFQQTRRDSLPQVLRGLETLARFPEAHPIKVNAVAIRDFTEQEILPFARFAREQPYEVRFIEFMPLDGDRNWKADARADGRGDPRPDPRGLSVRARAARALGDGAGRTASPTGRAGSASSTPCLEPFCGDCNRIRLTADGKLRTCLFSLNETDLRGPMRDGESDEMLEQIIRDAVWKKELKHHVGEPGFIQPARSMSAIGG